MALTRLFVHDTFYDATDNYTYTPGMRLTLDNTTQSARITRLQNSGVVSTDETIDPSGVAITGGNIDGTVIGATTAAAGTFTTITVDTTTLVTDAANNRVGVGTASPAYTLAVEGATNAAAKLGVTKTGGATIEVAASSTEGSIASSGGAVAFYPEGTRAFQATVNQQLLLETAPGASNPALSFAGDANMGIYRAGADSLGIAAGGSAVAVFDGTGLGIGTTSPGQKLHIADDNNPTVQVVDTTNNVTTFLQSVNGDGIVGTSSNHAFKIRTNNVDRIRVLTDGNVGLNETAPDYLLDVNGTFGFTPGTSVTPVDNGDVVFEATNNTTFTVKLKGTDGTVRSGTVTLA